MKILQLLFCLPLLFSCATSNGSNDTSSNQTSPSVELPSELSSSQSSESTSKGATTSKSSVPDLTPPFFTSEKTSSGWQEPDIALWTGEYRYTYIGAGRPIAGKEVASSAIFIDESRICLIQWRMLDDETDRHSHITFSFVEPGEGDHPTYGYALFSPAPQEGDDEPPYFIEYYKKT